MEARATGQEIEKEFWGWRLGPKIINPHRLDVQADGDKDPRKLFDLTDGR